MQTKGLAGASEPTKSTAAILLTSTPGGQAADALNTIDIDARNLDFGICYASCMQKHNGAPLRLLAHKLQQARQEGGLVVRR